MGVYIYHITYGHLSLINLIKNPFLQEVYPLVDDDDDSDDDEEIAGYQQQLRQLKRNKFKKKLDSDLEEEAEDDSKLCHWE